MHLTTHWSAVCIPIGIRTRVHDILTRVVHGCRIGSMNSTKAPRLRLEVDYNQPSRIIAGDGPASADSWHTVRWRDRAARQDGPYPVCVRLGEAPDGRLVMTGLLIGFPEPVEITARSLRMIPVAPLLADLARDEFSREVFGYTAQPLRRPVRRGPRGLDDRHFEEVAATYRRAVKEGPGRTVMRFRELWPTSEATARRWIQRARDKGLLGPAQPGKAGERPRTETTE